MIKIKRALISCWDKSGLVEMGKILQKHGVEIISSGGTAVHLEKNQIQVIPVDKVTQHPEVLGGRVKTLHPNIHAGILAKRDKDHLKDLDELNIEPIDLVVANLYPFVDEALKNNLSFEDAIEFIDIGGPAMLRAAAKNCQYVVPLFSTDQYAEFIELFEINDGQIPEEYSMGNAHRAFFYTSWYDSQVYRYFNRILKTESGEMAPYFCTHLEKKSDLRYGENPHQKAALYQPYQDPNYGFGAMDILWGKALSFNNYMDVKAAYEAVLEFSEPTVVIVKHMNPCGAAISTISIEDAYIKALRGDSLSAFGGIVAVNRTINENLAHKMSEIFLECVIAPDFEEKAMEILTRKKNIRLLKLDPSTMGENIRDIRTLNGVTLIQTPDNPGYDVSQWKLVTSTAPSASQQKDLEFAWRICKHVKSNAIVLAKDQEIYGVGAGQMSRVDSVAISIMKALHAQRDLEGTVMASDAFFPFRDGVEKALAAGVKAVVQPGGSKRDDEVIAAANEHGIAMYFTGNRHFKH